ncbi:hypothetical protein DBT42_08485 [Aerococcus urinae]|nr:hypothetical protein DBT42_08485 [Aerococcus urinae]
MRKSLANFLEKRKTRAYPSSVIYRLICSSLFNCLIYLLARSGHGLLRDGYGRNGLGY